ncbi:MAG: LCP family protein [Tissierellales bacterium]|nr:LCP family protein [Tissierellales bacterium]MBN2826822.1 LCP family protein [Tissierellales bacterium]
MKVFIKVFFVTLLCFILALGAGLYTYVKFFNPSDIEDYTHTENPSWVVREPDGEEEPSALEKAILSSKRINILLLGLEHSRTDTIMLVSFDRATAKADIISIPRDTFFHREGYDDPGSKKINAIYGVSGAQGVMKAIENIMRIPVHGYATIDYEGVRHVVDVIGGVEVNVPFHMLYEDPYDVPPLIIDIPQGVQILDGNKALQYLRFRHNNDFTVGYSNGDLGRIEAQQKFVKSAIKKAMGFKLPVVAKEIYPFIKTDLSLSDMVLLAGDAINFKSEDLNAQMIPGHATMIDRVSFFVHDPRMVQDLVYELYGVEDESEPVD